MAHGKQSSRKRLERRFCSNSDAATSTRKTEWIQPKAWVPCKISRRGHELFPELAVPVVDALAVRAARQVDVVEEDIASVDRLAVSASRSSRLRFQSITEPAATARAALYRGPLVFPSGADPHERSAASFQLASRAYRSIPSDSNPFSASPSRLRAREASSASLRVRSMSAYQ